MYVSNWDIGERNFGVTYLDEVYLESSNLILTFKFAANLLAQFPIFAIWSFKAWGYISRTYVN